MVDDTTHCCYCYLRCSHIYHSKFPHQPLHLRIILASPSYFLSGHSTLLVNYLTEGVLVWAH